MKGDFTRDTFDPARHFTRVLQQQARHVIDADWNEQIAIMWHYLWTLATDLVGPFAGPGDGFAIALGDNSFTIHPGRYYVDGILCENPVVLDGEGNKVPLTYDRQPAYPLDENRHRLPAGPYLVYLDVWERHITFVEDDSIREVALGGPDTATRAQVVWQVKVAERIGNDQIPPAPPEEQEWPAWVEERWPGWTKQWQPEDRGRLSAWAKESGERDAEPCAIPPRARYRGPENQLYRVEIHRSGPKGQATFKWSRDNGSLLVPWVGQEDDRLCVRATGFPGRGFSAGQWVEVTDDDRELRGEEGILVRLSQVEGDWLIMEPGSATEPIEWDERLKNPKVRGWDHRVLEPGRPRRGGGQKAAPAGAIPVVENQPIELEQGVTIQFAPSESAYYRSGDYWLIPARVATRDVEWPQVDGRRAVLPPRGVTHHYAPLTIITPAQGGNPAEGHDLRRPMPGA